MPQQFSALALARARHTVLRAWLGDWGWGWDSMYPRCRGSSGCLAVEGRVPVFFQGRTGGMVPTPGEVVDAVSRASALTAPTQPSSVPEGEGR